MGKDKKTGKRKRMARATARQPFDAQQLLTRERLIERWQHGSDSFFWRAEKDGLLIPVIYDGLLRYRWHDVFQLEGGLPDADHLAAYAENLLTETEVAALFHCSTDVVFRAARTGSLPCRRVGRAYRFVPLDVEHWNRVRWTRRKRKVNGDSQKNSPDIADESNGG
ncbi:MAG: hypothetical protein ACU0B7_00930 [Paracoccaceae bacterium]